MITVNFEENLADIKQRIAEEKLDTACVQLHGLIFLFPREVFLRPMLAEIYWKLGDAVMAGRFWYLVENKTPEIEAVCREFEEHYENDLLKIFYLLIEDFKNEKENVIGTAAEKPLRELQEKAHQQKVGVRHPPMDFFAEPPIFDEKKERETEWFVRGCMLAIVIVLILAIVGFFSIVQLLK